MFCHCEINNGRIRTNNGEKSSPKIVKRPHYRFLKCNMKKCWNEECYCTANTRIHKCVMFCAHSFTMYSIVKMHSHYVIFFYISLGAAQRRFVRMQIDASAFGINLKCNGSFALWAVCARTFIWLDFMVFFQRPY